MPKYSIIDTETSGLPNFKLPADDPSQPRLASVTWIDVEEDLSELFTFSTLIQPDGWEISPEITAINGLTTERCAAEGLPIADVLNLYERGIKSGLVMVAWHAQFDLKIMRGEFRRLGMDDLFEQTPNICCMRGSGGLGIEKAGDKKGGFPKLSDAYRHFEGEEMADAHTSLADAQACLKIFRKLMALGVAPAPQVHYAKNPPAGKAPAAAAEA